MYKEKKCKVCEANFKQFRSTQKVCSTQCAIKLAETTRERLERREWLKQKKILKDKTMTVTQWVMKVQVVFNAYIRERDRATNCISCERPLVGKFDAGHYHNAHFHWSVRFDPRNVWGQCVQCNRDLNGNLIRYRYGLLQRIGPDELDKLDEIAAETRKFTIPELKDLFSEFSDKKKALINSRESTD